MRGRCRGGEGGELVAKRPSSSRSSAAGGRPIGSSCTTASSLQGSTGAEGSSDKEAKYSTAIATSSSEQHGKRSLPNLKQASGGGRFGSAQSAARRRVSAAKTGRRAEPAEGGLRSMRLPHRRV